MSTCYFKKLINITLLMISNQFFEHNFHPQRRLVKKRVPLLSIILHPPSNKKENQKNKIVEKSQKTMSPFFPSSTTASLRNYENIWKGVKSRRFSRCSLRKTIASEGKVGWRSYLWVLNILHKNQRLLA